MVCDICVIPSVPRTGRRGNGGIDVRTYSKPPVLTVCVQIPVLMPHTINIRARCSGNATVNDFNAVFHNNDVDHWCHDWHIHGQYYACYPLLPQLPSAMMYSGPYIERPL